MNSIKALTVPKWGLSMDEGTLVKWLVNEGDVINEGDEVAEIESSKIVNVLETHSSGILRRKVAQQEETLAVGALLAVIAESDVPDCDIDAFISSFSFNSNSDYQIKVVQTGDANNVATPVLQSSQSQLTAANDSEVPATPRARKLARQLGINLNDCQRSGSRGRVTPGDVEAAKALTQQPGAGAEQMPMNNMRQTIARRLQTSAQSAPHFRLVVDVELDELLALNTSLNESQSETKITITDLLLKACAMALMDVPECNVQFNENTVYRFKDADIAIAVALDEGLITPIIKAANSKDLIQISRETKQLAAKAKAGSLMPDEFEGGTFTISNLGMYGIKQFDAIINQPQCAILAVGSAEQRMLVKNGEAAIATVLSLTLSLDHRVIDGVLGAKFMQALTRYITQPQLLSR